MNKVLKKILATCLWPFFRSVVRMPGSSHAGVLSGMSAEEMALVEELRQHLQVLAVDIGDRSLRCPQAQAAAIAYIDTCFRSAGYQTEKQLYSIPGVAVPATNVVCELPGTKYPERIFVVGAHYDTVPGTPGADDNGSGVAGLLALAKAFAGSPQECTLRFVAFSNEEAKARQEMGSFAYAKRCAERGENIIGMFSLEMLGAYSDEEGSQHYPFPFSLFYPTKANFIAFVGNRASRLLVERSVESFRSLNRFPCEGCVAPDWLKDAGRSDHGSFWPFAFPALMVTDTAEFRFCLYHTAQDTVDKLDFERFARVVHGLNLTIVQLLRSDK
ncbi:MAG: M20/M25/M40 family metallo-hydrolase [Candidatus Obscuribacterales bacterium]|jgi:hypothetical protein|nr:M20/M25/M40 family metallo-hydrolase [Candidatus Obscuribacterales bacterium]